MFKCKHRNKKKVDMEIIDYASTDAQLVGIVTPIILGKFTVWRCLDCKCIVWEEK